MKFRIVFILGLRDLKNKDQSVGGDNSPLVFRTFLEINVWKQDKMKQMLHITDLNLRLPLITVAVLDRGFSTTW